MGHGALDKGVRGQGKGYGKILKYSRGRNAFGWLFGNSWMGVGVVWFGYGEDNFFFF